MRSRSTFFVPIPMFVHLIITMSTSASSSSHLHPKHHLSEVRACLGSNEWLSGSSSDKRFIVWLGFSVLRITSSGSLFALIIFNQSISLGGQSNRINCPVPILSFTLSHFSLDSYWSLFLTVANVNRRRGQLDPPVNHPQSIPQSTRTLPCRWHDTGTEPYRQVPVVRTIAVT